MRPVWFLIALATVVCPVAFGGESEVTELQIDAIKGIPAEECTIKSRVGDKLKMHYTGTLVDGTEFDSSIPRGDPLEFTLGMGEVIEGWDQGLLGMCQGEKRKLTIPPNLGYGETGSPPKIPGNSVLIFEVELIEIKRNQDLRPGLVLDQDQSA